MEFNVFVIISYALQKILSSIVTKDILVWELDSFYQAA